MSIDLLAPQGTLPHLIEFLLLEYRRHAEAKGIDGATAINDARPVLDFFVEYLRENRPIRIFPVDNNYGILLASNIHCVISPDSTTVPGDMQPSMSIPICRGI